MKTDREIYTFFGKVMGKKRIYIVYLLLAQVILGISGVFYALFTRNAIDAAVGHSKVVMLQNMAFFVGIIIITLALRAFVRFMEEYTRSSFENAFKDRLFSRLLRGDYGSVVAVHSGDWMNRLTSDTVVVAEGLTTIVPGVMGMGSKLFSAMIMILIIEPRFGYVVIPAGFFLLVLATLFRKKLKTLHKDIQKKDGFLRIFLQENLIGIMIVKVFSREDATEKDAKLKMNAHKKARMKRNHFSNVCNIGFGAIMNGAYAFALIYSAYGIYHGTVSYGTLVALLQLVRQVQDPFANITGYLPKYYAMIGSGERLYEAESLIPEERIVPNITGTFISLNLKCKEFSYSTRTVVENFSLLVNKGCIVAFTGPSGCGKSTVLKLLLSLYSLNCGSYTITLQHDGITEEFPAGSEFRSLFAYVPQGNMLMSGSIREAITFADPEKMQDDDGISRALEIACADEFVEALDDGIDEVLGESGTGLSEGQMQRIAIARAIFSDRPILLLDEATSALDENTEKRLLENISKMTDKTVIIVTHKRRALEICDRQIDFGVE